MRGKRTDDNHAEIVAALRSLGWDVYDCSAFGNGFPDTLVRKGVRQRFVEIKDGSKAPSRRRLTDAERAFARRFSVWVVESVADAERFDRGDMDAFRIPGEH